MVLRGFGSITMPSLYTNDGGATWHEANDVPGQNTFAIDPIPNTQTIVSYFMDTKRKMLFSAATNDLGKTWNSYKDIVTYVPDSLFYAGRRAGYGKNPLPGAAHE